MYWLYFARDFYRPSRREASEVAAPAQAARLATVVFREPPPMIQKPMKAKHALKRQQSFVVKSEPVAESSKSVFAWSAPLLACMERLSADGIHAFAAWDEERGFSLFSENFERITGLKEADCLGHDWIHFIDHAQQYAVNDALLAALEGRNGRCLVQTQAAYEGAEPRWLMLDVKAPREEHPCVVVLLADITEQKALEAAVQQTNSALALSERGRTAFLSSMSHELRTPLNAIMGFAEMMKTAVFGELGNPTYKEYARHIHSSGNTLLSKINDLIDIASMDAGGLTLEETSFSLGELLEEALEMQSHHAFARKQTIRLDCPYALELLGDRTKLLCALTHLLTNALRHSADGASITLAVSIQHDEGAILSVRDEGEGIPAAQLEIIREALAAENSYFCIRPGGIGLGLSLSKELIARHDGRVMIDSIRHRGTVVSLLLPCDRILAGMPKRRGARASLELVGV